jgi:hypothetical protein
MSIYHVTLNGVKKEVISDSSVDAIAACLKAYNDNPDNAPDQCLATQNICVCATYAGEPITSDGALLESNFLEIE